MKEKIEFNVFINGIEYSPVEKKKKKKIEKWEPKEGRWCVSRLGLPFRGAPNKARQMFGNSFSTEDEALERARSQKVQNWLYQLKLELCPDFEPDWTNHEQRKWLIIFDHARERWTCDHYEGFTQFTGQTYFTEDASEKVADMLNNGQIEYE